MQEIKNMTTYRHQLRERILTTAMTAFVHNGIKAVKMDDIAQELGISKRTLYELYENKEVLLFEGVKKYKAQKREEFERMRSAKVNVMDIILRAYQQKVEEFKVMNPQFYVDIERYPMVMDYLDADKKRAHQSMMEFLYQGVEEGFFRSDVDYDLVTRLFSGVTQAVMNYHLYRNYSIEHIFKNILFVMLRGLCTQKGVDVLDGFFIQIKRQDD